MPIRWHVLSLGLYHRTRILGLSRYRLIKYSAAYTQGGAVAFAVRFPTFKRQTKNLFLGMVALLGLVYLAPKGISISGVGGMDFRDIWVAGQIWAAGEDPYGSSFAAEYLAAFGYDRGEIWLYPPYWYPIAAPLGLFSFSVANSVWKAINFLLLIGGIHLTARALADDTRVEYITLFFAGINFACFLRATSLALSIGQTSILVFFGFSIMIYGILKGRSFALIVGLLFLSLKPQIGVVAFAAVVALRQHRWVILPCVAICFLATIPIAAFGNYRASIEGFLANLPQQQTLGGNTPAHLPGLGNILGYVFPNFAGFSSLILLVSAAVAISFVIGRFLTDKNLQCQISSLVVILVSALFLIPVHVYDLVSLTVILMLIVAWPLSGRWLMAIGLMLCLRPDVPLRVSNIEAQDLVFAEIRLLSGGLLLVFVGAFWSFRKALGSQAPSQNS